MVLPGDLGFMTGLTAGRREASQVDSEWRQYAQELNNQIASLSQQLAHEKAYRTINRANIAGIISALSTLPPAVQEQVKAALAKHHCPAFVHRAVELGLPQDIALQSAQVEQIELDRSIRMLPSR